jgi:large subunit ribosomal protein L15
MTKKKRNRGSGTHGGGSKKKRRGAGSRGGRGSDGYKHRKLKFMKEGGEKEKGFKRPEKLRKDLDTINLKQLEIRVDKLLEEGELEEKEDGVEVNLPELGYDKLLGSGKVTRSLIVESKEFSEKARQKLEEAGGKAVELS